MPARIFTTCLHQATGSRLRGLLLAAAFAAGTAAWAQATPSGDAGCQQDEPMADSQLPGQWAGSIDGQDTAVHLQLGPHPQWRGMVKGTIERAGAVRPMVGDVEDGNVTLEASADGKHISATWLGTAVEGSCAREIRGDYIEGENAPPRAFVLRRVLP